MTTETQFKIAVWFERLRTLILTSITPRQPQANAYDLLGARVMMVLCYLMIGLGALVILLSQVDQVFPALPIYTTALLIFTLYARFGRFNIGKYVIVMGIPLLTLVVSLSGEPYADARVLIITFAVMFMLANVMINLRDTLWLGGAMLTGLAVAASQVPDFFTQRSIITYTALALCMMALLLRALVDHTLRQRLMTQQEDLQTTMEAVNTFTVGFIYRAALQPDATMKMEVVFGSPITTVGMSEKQVIAANGWESSIHPEDVAQYRRHWREIVSQGKSSVDYRVRAGDLWLSLRDFKVLTQDGNVRYVHGVLRNVTDQVKAETDLRNHVLQQAVIAEMGMRAIEFNNLNDLAQHATACIEQVIDISGCEIYQHLPDTDEIVLLAAAGSTTRPERRLSLRDHTLPMRAALRDDVLILNNIDSTPPYNEHAFFIHHQIRHCVVTSLKGSHTPLGLAAVYSTGEAAFSTNEVYFLQSLSNILATFEENRRIQAAERKQQELTVALREAVTLLVTELDLQTVLDRILETLRTLIPNHDASTLMLCDEPGQEMRFASQRGYDHFTDKLRGMTFLPSQSVKYEALLKNRYVIINDTANEPSWTKREGTDWIASYLGAPILIDGNFMGLINLDSRYLNAFNHQDGVILSAFAEKAALAIRNARRTAELERLVQERTHALDSERQQLQMILDSTGEGIYYTENDVIYYANAALLMLTEYTREELIGQLVTRIHPQQPSDAPDISQVRRSEGIIVSKDGRMIQTEMTASRMYGPNVRVVTVVRDVSAQREVEIRQRRFISNAAHELRTPVTNFNTRLYLLERRPDKITEHLPILKRISARMNRLVADLLDSATIEHGHLVLQKGSIVLQDILNETCLLVETEAQYKNIRLTFDLPEEETVLQADGHRLQQVFTNLVMNAVHYTPEGGTVTVRQWSENGTVTVDVMDTGIGIALEHQTSIFEPFFRVETRHVGTGLGLAISNEIIKLHNGSISVVSALGKGSTFSVTLPVDV